MYKANLNPDKITRRTFERLEIVEGRSCYLHDHYSWPAYMGQSNSDFTYYDIILKSSGFLRRQVSLKFNLLILKYAIRK